MKKKSLMLTLILAFLGCVLMGLSIYFFFEGSFNANEKIDAHIKSIRKVLKEFQEYKLITVRGKGYYLRIP